LSRGFTACESEVYHGLAFPAISVMKDLMAFTTGKNESMQITSAESLTITKDKSLTLEIKRVKKVPAHFKINVSKYFSFFYYSLINFKMLKLAF
jgi:hypothetical protein